MPKRGTSIRRGVDRALLALACLCAVASAQDKPTEQSMRAAMVFNFLKFTEFPPDAAGDAQRLRLCISVGDSAQAEALAALSGRKVWNRELLVVRLGERDEYCQIVYVDTRQRWNAALENRRFSGALTISAYRGFVVDGGIIEIDLQSDGNRFDVNLAQARLARLRLSPQLLRLARRIHE
jgi:hypothetical protein